MTLIAGTKLGPYEIVAPIGAAGFGEVYRACEASIKPQGSQAPAENTTSHTE